MPAIQALCHEHEVPPPRPRAVDDVLPSLRRQPLCEIGAQPGNAARNVQRCVPAVARIAGLAEPELKVVTEVAPEALRDMVEMARRVAAGGLATHAVVEPVGFVLVGAGIGLVGNQRGVTAEEKVGHVGPFAEVEAVWRIRHVVGAACPHVVLTGAREHACFHRADGRGVRYRLVRPVTHAGRRQLQIVCSVVERHVEEQANALRRRLTRKRLELGQCQRAACSIVVLGHACAGKKSGCHQWHHCKVVFHRVGTSQREGLSGRRISQAAGDAARMDRLQPQRVDAELLQILQTEMRARAGGWCRHRGEGAALRGRGAACGDAERVGFVELDVACLCRRDDDCEIALEDARCACLIVIPVPGAGRVAGYTVTCSDAVGASLAGSECDLVAAGDRLHANGVVVVALVADVDRVSQRRADAFFHALGTDHDGCKVAPIEVGEHVGFHNVGCLRIEEDGDWDRVVRHLIDEQVRHAVIGLDLATAALRRRRRDTKAGSVSWQDRPEDKSQAQQAPGNTFCRHRSSINL